jgi:D-alanyl-lipoteichoic acid acyltransferase DltB (MBOAT superfamily)
MDVISLVNNTTKIFKYLAIFLVFVGLLVAQQQTTTGVENIKKSMKTLCDNAVALMTGAIIVLIVLAAVVYAGGQVMGAETRARATVWATAMLTGAVIGAILYVIVPYIILQMIGQTGSFDPSKPCESIAPQQS